MIIKHPHSDNAAKNLCDLLQFTGERFNQCVRQGHQSISILYISSLIISPYVTCGNQSLIDKFVVLARMFPSNFICAVRTTAPSYFRGDMERVHKEAVDELRGNCYVLLFDRRGSGFLNHAKFFVYYHICLSEGIIYHWKYFGSTNITVDGLAFSVNRLGRLTRLGNYEEFAVTKPRPKLALTRGDVYYLNEVLDVITHKEALYTDTSYLEAFLRNHMITLENVIRYGQAVLSGSTLGELYEAYINVLAMYHQMIALLEELPGKRLTERQIREMTFAEPPNPFELELLLPGDSSQAEEIAKELGLQGAELREWIRKYIGILIGFKQFGESYLKYVKSGGIRQFLDSIEVEFETFVRSYAKQHKEIIAKALNKFGPSRG